MERKLAVVTSSRADYSHLYWVLRELARQPNIKLTIITMGPHLSPEFGHTANNLTADGFATTENIECLLSSDTDVGMAKTIGVATLGLADCLGKLRPDMVLLIADRYEMLAPASVALALRIPIAHIEGGDVSMGAIDDAVRNALTKLSHIHFTTTENSRKRVIRMGEEPWRVHTVGSPSLDHLTKGTLFTREEVENRLGIPLDENTIAVIYHPLTIARDTLCETTELFAALKQLPQKLLFINPNSDAGSRELSQRIRGFMEDRSGDTFITSIEHRTYLSLLQHVAVLVGNSSSGIMESASFKLPAVNIGMRQKGRERGQNVLDCAAERGEIEKAIRMALREDFRASLNNSSNPYGDGHSAEKIARILSSVSLSETLLVKEPVSIHAGEAAMNVPLAKPEITEADIAAVVDVLRSSRLSQGPVMQAFEQALAAYLNLTHAVTVNSGTSALQLALRALGIKDGDEVIIPSFSFMAVTNAVLNERATPVFADIEKNTFNLDPAGLAPLLSSKTKAIIVVHSFGYPAAITRIVQFAQRHSLYVIEDACEALGAEVNGRKAGSFGDVGIFAFYPNKQITTGEGGALVTHSATIAERVRALRNQGRDSSTEEWFQNREAGHSYRLSDMNCALGLQQLSRMEQILSRREALARSYEERLRNSEHLTCYGNYFPDGRVSWFTYPVLLPETFARADRDAIWARLKQMEVESGRYFPPAHLQPVLRDATYRHGDLARTISIAERLLCLPFFNSLQEEQIEFVCSSLEKTVEEHMLSQRRSRAAS